MSLLLLLKGGGQTTHELEGAQTAQAALAGALTTAIQLAGEAQAVAAQAGAITTEIRLNAAAEAVVTATAGLTTAITAAGAAEALATALADLATEIRLAGVAESDATAAGALTVAVRLAGEAQALAGALGDLTLPKDEKAGFQPDGFQPDAFQSDVDFMEEGGPDAPTSFDAPYQAFRKRLLARNPLFRDGNPANYAQAIDADDGRQAQAADADESRQPANASPAAAIVRQPEIPRADIAKRIRQEIEGLAAEIDRQMKVSRETLRFAAQRAAKDKADEADFMAAMAVAIALDDED